jgi:sugar phosphate isomerase/epimerase
MNNDLRNYMTVGIVHFMAFPQTMGGEGPIAETVAKIASDPFFGAIEVGPIKDAAVRAEVREMLKMAKMVVGFGAQPIQLANKLDVNSLDETKRREAVDRLKGGVDMAIEVGASRLALLSGPDSGEANRGAATQKLIESIVELSDYAASKGNLPLTLETFDRTIDKKSLVGPAAEAVEVANAVRRKHPEFGLMLDLSHLPLQFETAREALPVTKDVLVHAHIGNCVLKEGHPLYGDLHPGFGVEGGENDVEELTDFLRVLLDIGYIGEGSTNIVAFEVRPHGNDKSEMVIAGAKRTLEQAWRRV